MTHKPARSHGETFAQTSGKHLQVMEWRWTAWQLNEERKRYCYKNYFEVPALNLPSVPVASVHLLSALFQCVEVFLYDCCDSNALGWQWTVICVEGIGVISINRISSVVYFSTIQFIFNCYSCHKGALQKCGCRFWALISQPEASKIHSGT